MTLRERIGGIFAPYFGRKDIAEGDMLPDKKVAAWGYVIAPGVTRFNQPLVPQQRRGWFLLVKLPIFRHGEGVMLCKKTLFVGWWQTWLLLSKVAGEDAVAPGKLVVDMFEIATGESMADPCEFSLRDGVAICDKVKKESKP